MTAALDALRVAAQHPNVVAFLRLIRERESGQGDDAFSIINGGTHFADFSRHPYDDIPTTKGGRAAGAFQFLGTTWAHLREQYGFEDFSPESQTLGAVALIQGRHALSDVMAGDIEAAIAECRPEWTSLPGAAESSAAWTMSRAIECYRKWGGSLAPTERVEPAPIEERDLSGVPPRVEAPEPVVQPETPMPLFLALLPMITSMIPELLKVFGSGATSEVAKRNVAAAGVVTEALVKATGAVNLQAAVEAMQADPKIAETARAAVVEEPALQMLMEVGDGGIGKARQVAADPNSLPFYKQGAFVMGLVLTPLVYMVTYQVLWSPDYSEQLRTVVVTAILSGLLGALTGFFFGSMYSTTKRAGDGAVAK